MAERYGTRTGVREVLLTFDDGPSPKTTPKLLDILALHGVKAVFFVLGERVAATGGRALVERAQREGHQIGNHSYSHRDLKTLSQPKVRDELRRTQNLIGTCAGDCNLFRPPYGSTNLLVTRVLQEEGYVTVMWNVDTLDWKLKKDGAWVEHGTTQIKAREDSLVLMHDIHPTTVDHVDAFIQRIKRMASVEFVLFS